MADKQVNIGGLEFLAEPAVEFFVINGKSQLLGAAVKVIAVDVNVDFGHEIMISGYKHDNQTNLFNFKFPSLFFFCPLPFFKFNWNTIFSPKLSPIFIRLN